MAEYLTFTASNVHLVTVAKQVNNSLIWPFGHGQQQILDKLEGDSFGAGAFGAVASQSSAM